MGSLESTYYRTCQCSTFYIVRNRDSEHDYYRSNEECCCSDGGYCVCPPYRDEDDRIDCQNCYETVCRCKTFYVRQGGRYVLHRCVNDCCCTWHGDNCVCPPYDNNKLTERHRICSCETYYFVEEKGDRRKHYRSDSECCCRLGRNECVCPPYRARNTKRCDCCYRRTCGCTTFYILQRDNDGDIEGHVLYRSDDSCCCSCGGDYCVCPPYKDPSLFDLIECRRKFINRVHQGRGQNKSSAILRPSAPAIPDILQLVLGPAGPCHRATPSAPEWAPSSALQRATPSAPPMPNMPGMRPWPSMARTPDTEPSGGRRIPEVNIRMPDGNVAHITEPNPTNCVCSTRAATVQISLRPNGKMSAQEYKLVKTQMYSTLVRHRNNIGGVYTRFEIVDVLKLKNCCLFKRYKNCQLELIKEVGAGNTVERLLFHGSPNLDDIVNKGFDERYSSQGGYFGAGIYFAAHSSKSNQYVLGFKGGKGCRSHQDSSCYTCKRQLLLCRVLLGKINRRTTPEKMSHAPPGFHSVEGVTSPGFLQYPEYVVYKGEQAYPEYLISYKIVK